jgi:hypothetical protein
MFIEDITKKLDQIIVETARRHPENALFRDLARSAGSGDEGSAEHVKHDSQP